MPNNLTYSEFVQLSHEFRRVLQEYFIIKGVYSKIIWCEKLFDSQDKTNFEWEVIVELRKFYFEDGSVIKPNITFSDIDPIEGIYYNMEHLNNSAYYNRYPEVFPRFLYNRPMVCDAKEHGVGPNLKHTLGRLRLFIRNNGNVRVGNCSDSVLRANNSSAFNVFITNTQTVFRELPECYDIIKLIQTHYTHPFIKAQKRAQLIERELCETVMKKDFMKDIQKIQASRSLNDYFMLFQNLDEPY
jgi:hypothetical protein